MKKVLALLLALAMAFALVACGGNTNTETPADTDNNTSTTDDAAPADNTSSDGVQVGIVLPTKEEPRWLQDEASFEAALSSAGFTSEVLFSQGKSETELSNVEALLEKIKV